MVSKAALLCVLALGSATRTENRWWWGTSAEDEEDVSVNETHSVINLTDESSLTHASQASHVVSRQPAALLVATNKSLNLVQQATPLLQAELARLTIPASSGWQYGFEWVAWPTAYNPVVESMAMHFMKGVGVKVMIASVRIDTSTRLTVKGTEWHNNWVKFETQLSTTPTISNVATQIRIDIVDGQPSIEVLNVDFHFNLGDMRWGQGDGHAINVVLEVVRPKLEEYIKTEVRSILHKFVSNSLQNELAKFNMKIPLNMQEPFKPREVHTEPTSLEVHEDRIVSDLRLKLVDPDDPSNGLWITTATPLPKDYDADKMFTLNLAPELFESFISEQHKYVKHVVKKGDAEGWLTTYSLRFATFPKLNSGWFGANFGTQDMQVVVSVDGNTSVQFHDGYINVAAPTIFKFEVVKNDTAPVLAFEASQKVHMDCQLAVENGTVQSRVSNVNVEEFNITKKHDSIWWVWRRGISSIINLAEHQIVVDERHALSDLKVGDQFQSILENSYTKVIPGGLTIRSDIPLGAM